MLDGVSGDSNIAGIWASKLHSLLNSRSALDSDFVSNLVSDCDVSGIFISSDVVWDALSRLKANKSDG